MPTFRRFSQSFGGYSTALSAATVPALSFAHYWVEYQLRPGLIVHRWHFTSVTAARAQVLTLLQSTPAKPGSLIHAFGAGTQAHGLLSTIMVPPSGESATWYKTLGYWFVSTSPHWAGADYPWSAD